MASSLNKPLWRLRVVTPRPHESSSNVHFDEYWFEDRDLALLSRDRVIIDTLVGGGYLQWKCDEDTGSEGLVLDDELDAISADPVGYWDDNIDSYTEYEFRNASMDVNPLIEVEEFKPRIERSPVETYLSDDVRAFINVRHKRKRSASPTTSLQRDKKKGK